MEVESNTAQGQVIDSSLLQITKDVPPEFWQEIEHEEIKISDPVISMVKEESKPDISKPSLDESGKPICLRYISNAIPILKYLYKELPIDEENDIKKDFYEGGFKIWECTLDLLKYLNETLIAGELKGKNVIDIGCGQGLLGLEALLCGASSIFFQDFNLEVLKFAVLPNFHLNGITELLPRAKFLSGDWSTTYEKVCSGINDVAIKTEAHPDLQNVRKFELVLMSEVLYCKENYDKLTKLIIDLLSDTGLCLISTKVYYFGCTGSLPDFREYLRERCPGLSFKSVRQIKNKNSNKREIIALSLQK